MAQKFLTEEEKYQKKLRLQDFVVLENDYGMLQKLDLGSNFWLLFVGPLLPLFQKEFKIAGVWFGLSMIAALALGEFSVFFTLPLTIYYMVTYNKQRVERYLMNGWTPSTELDRDILIRDGFIGKDYK